MGLVSQLMEKKREADRQITMVISIYFWINLVVTVWSFLWT